MRGTAQSLTIDQVVEMLRGAGLRRTLSRLHISQYLSECPVPPTHAEVAAALVRFGFDDSTIFRTLNDLVRRRVVMRFDVGDHTWRYSLRSSDETGDSRAYAVCTECSSIERLTTPAGIVKESGRRHWQIEEILVKGRCPACRSKKTRSR
jgi:Fur family transcriptional regulator, ferric uptake regulator